MIQFNLIGKIIIMIHTQFVITTPLKITTKKAVFIQWNIEKVLFYCMNLI